MQKRIKAKAKAKAKGYQDTLRTDHFVSHTSIRPFRERTLCERTLCEHFKLFIQKIVKIVKFFCIFFVDQIFSLTKLFYCKMIFKNKKMINNIN